MVFDPTSSVGDRVDLSIAREREAMREILGVISHSRDDEQPVFETILRKAVELCGANVAGLNLVNREATHLEGVATFGHKGEGWQAGKYRFAMDEANGLVRTVIEGRTQHVPDLADTDGYRDGTNQTRVSAVDSEGIRTWLSVPLLSDGGAIGCFGLTRTEVKPFTDDEIALVETFAAQAVIAIENVRQFRELQTRLDREAASREILAVISQSREDDIPVFDTILERAQNLCAAPLGLILLGADNEADLRLAAHRGATRKWVDELTRHPPLRAAEASMNGLCAVERKVVHLDDLSETSLYRDGQPLRRKAVEVEGIRTALSVPLIKGAEAIGTFCLYRREVKPFTPDQIALVETFAAQAVIAIENVRQFRELQTRLEREAATREILQVISRSRDDEQPVFRVILDCASRLCKAPLAFLAVANEAGTHVKLPATLGMPADAAVTSGDFNEPIEGSDLIAVKAVANGEVIRSADLRSDTLHLSQSRWRSELVDVLGVRSIMVVPLMNNGKGVGAIILYRCEVQPFSDDDLALVQAFAAQAVIAIENVRQFRAIQTLNAELETRVEAQVGELERMGRLKRFLPPAVADAVVSSGSEGMLESHRALVGILFADIRGFTAFCEQAEPEETIEVLQTYHEEMGELISDHAVGVDHRSGDGIMVIFNDPLPCEDPAGEAVRLAVAMRARMAELCRQWRKMGHRLGFGVGISLGYATVGMVGSEGRYEYTASGTAVNLAARLCDHAQDGEILLSPRAFAAVEDEIDWEAAGELMLKGLAAPVEVRKVAG